MTRLRNAFFAFAVALSGLCCSPARTAKGPVPSNAFERMDDAVIALLEKNTKSSGMHIACTGVWVSASEFLSAAHCADITLTEDEQFLASMGFFPDLAGREMSFIDWRSQSGKEWDDVTAFQRATILSVDHDADLALFSVIGKALPHGFMKVASEPMKRGEHGWILGHTLGLAFSLSPATISAIRTLPSVVTGHKERYYQVDGWASYGNSGGPMTNDDGDLVGICSFRVLDDPISFFVHTSTLREFLKDNSIAL